MNGKDIFLGLKYVGEDLIEQAEYGTFSESKHRKPVRPLLMAALVALLLMLVGCAVAYVLNMQNMKIEKITESREILSENNMDIVGYRDVEMQVLTLAGLKGSPNYMAAQEWYRFQRSYDPNIEKYMELYNAGTLENFAPEFGGMSIYTQQMRDTMDSILSKYDLLPPGEVLNFRTLKKMCTALGIEKIQTAQNDVDIQISHGACYSNGNFDLTMQFALPEDEESPMNNTWGTLHWCRKNCFSPQYATLEDTKDWKEWNYTTAAGSNVLIFRSPSDWRCWIVCQREEAQMALELAVRTEMKIGSEIQYKYLPDRQIEIVADAVDFSIQPNKVTQKDVENQASNIPNAVQNGWNVELKDVQTDGYVLRIRLGITAPENRDITNSEEGFPYYVIFPGNRLEFFVPEAGEKNSYHWSWIPEEDGDGLDNTQDYIMTYCATMMDHSVPFGEGTVWNLLIEDLMHHQYNARRTDVESVVLSEGEWNYTIQFGEENGDYRVTNLLNTPMTLPVITQWDGDGNPIWGTGKVFNIELHRMSVHFISEHAELEYGEVNAVMKDGTIVPLGSSNYGTRCIYESDEWSDLDQVDYLLLQDGTIIPVPET